MNAEVTLAADCSESCVVPQHVAAYVQSTVDGCRATIVRTADVAAAPQFPRCTAIHGHWLPEIQGLAAVLAHTRGVRRRGVAARRGHRTLPSFRETAPFSSANRCEGSRVGHQGHRHDCLVPIQPTAVEQAIADTAPVTKNATFCGPNSTAAITAPPSNPMMGTCGLTNPPPRTPFLGTCKSGSTWLFPYKM